MYFYGKLKKPSYKVRNKNRYDFDENTKRAVKTDKNKKQNTTELYQMSIPRSNDNKNTGGISQDRKMNGLSPTSKNHVSA